MNGVKIDRVLKNQIIYDLFEIHKERIIIGWLKKNGYEYILKRIKILDSFGNGNYVLFSSEDQLKYIKSCIMEGEIPIIFHNHLYSEDYTFSDPDISFFNKFYNCYETLNDNSILFAGLINNENKTIQFMQIMNNQLELGKIITLDEYREGSVL